MSTNDVKIKQLLKVIEDKKKALGDKPRLALKGNGIIDTVNQTVNIHTISTLKACVSVTASIVQARDAILKAGELLELDQDDIDLDDCNNALEDLKTKAQILKWTAKDKQIKALERKLKDLRSEDQKTADTIDEIADLLM